ncbi:FAR1-related sequence 5-like protein [Tanacetum coccineum]|uniref:FAR1-related sequence 5-like protein n=1 Tax=Tanacetum coccineum TaxID=301880 RepID=A0ABQ5CP10_9ASTR
MDEVVVNKLNDLNKDIIQQENEVRLDGDDVLPDVVDPNTVMEEVTNFKERFDKIVWNMFIEPLEFEEKWAQLIEDFGLQSHKWLKKMFNLREIWIPAYFINSPLYGLMRTTSRSESENSFFKSFTSPGATLVSFMMSYESAMERQSKDEGKMGTYVENLKKLFYEVKADMPNPPSRDTGDVIGGIFSITKPDQIGVQNPTKAVNKGEHLKKGERLKSEREKALTVAKKKESLEITQITKDSVRHVYLLKYM